MGEWVDCIVKDVAAPERNALVGGPFGSKLVSADYVPDGVPVIRGKNMGLGRWVDGDFVFVSSEKAESLSANIARPGDIVFTQRGTLGQVAIVPDDQYQEYVISQSQMKLTANLQVADRKFLYYLFTSPLHQAYIRRNAIQTGVPHTNLGILRNTPLNLPPIDEQKAISAVLSAFDDKIELNRQMNATLEEMARAIFKSWFIDFDPVHAKALGEQPYGMDAETAALFPDRFEVVDGREVPASWRVVRIKEVANLVRDSVRPFDSPGEEFEHYSIPAFDNGKIPVIELGGGIKSNKYIVSSESVLLSKLNPRVPRVWFPDPGYSARSICSTELLVLVPYPEISREYLYALFTSRRFQRQFSTLVTGTSSSHQRVKPNYLLEMEVVIPSSEVMERFTKLTAAIYEKTLRNRQESQTLAKLRDTLLPRLMSGQLRVPVYQEEYQQIN